MTGDLTALDMALVPSFFISYGVVGLIQLNALFGGAYLRFAGLALGGVAVAFLFRLIDFAPGCAEPYSALICANDAEGLFGFAIAWTWVSGAMLGMFAFHHLLRALLRPR